MFLGDLYRYGFGVEKDAKKAFDLFHKAAELGHAWAFSEIGMPHINSVITSSSKGEMYADGSGTGEVNFKKAMEYFQLAVNLGHTRAHAHIGFLHEDGLGVPQDIAKAIEYFLIGADMGDDLAEVTLGKY